MPRATQEVYPLSPVSRARDSYERDIGLTPPAVRCHLLRSVRPFARILSILAILSAFALLIAAQTQTDQPTGAAELKKGNYENAVLLLTAQLANNPNDAEAETNLLRAFIETG